MKIDLSGKTAIVTGSTEGIGFAIAKALAEAQATVIINGRVAEKVDAAVSRLGQNVSGVVADLGTPEGMSQLTSTIPHADIVISNLGIFEIGDFFEVPDNLWDRHWQINVMAGVRLARHYLDNMKAQNWGRFILISSESAFNIPEDMIHYGVSKAADVALARGLAKRMAGTGVTVNSVIPGVTMTETITKMIEHTRDTSKGTFEDAANAFVRHIRPSSIIRRATTPEEVANMVIYLASPQASGTTGAALRVDGGIVDTL